jgi:hypothetical protein
MTGKIAEVAGGSPFRENSLVMLITRRSHVQTTRPLSTDGNRPEERWSRSGDGERLAFMVRTRVPVAGRVGCLSRSWVGAAESGRQSESGLGIEEDAEVFGRFAVAAVAFVCVDLGEGFDVVADPGCDGG